MCCSVGSAAGVDSCRCSLLLSFHFTLPFQDGFAKVAEAKDKAQTIDAILFDIALSAVCGEANSHQQQVHAVVLSLYRHCLKMSSDETTAEEAFGTFSSLPWLGLSGCMWAEVESFMNLRSRKMSLVLNERMATLDVCAFPTHS